MQPDDHPKNVEGHGEPGEWSVRDWEGSEISVRSGGFVDQLITESDENSYEKQLARGVMSWSLGKLGDVLWMMVPELRPAIAEVVGKELEDAISYDRYLHQLSSFDICDALSSTLVRSLRDLRVHRDTAVRCLAAMRKLIEDTGNMFRDSFANDVLDPVAFAGLWPTLAEVDPELIAVMRERAEWRGVVEFCESFGR